MTADDNAETIPGEELETLPGEEFGPMGEHGRVLTTLRDTTANPGPLGLMAFRPYHGAGERP